MGGRLAIREREALAASAYDLFYVQNLSKREIGRRLGISHHTAGVIIAEETERRSRQERGQDHHRRLIEQVLMGLRNVGEELAKPDISSHARAQNLQSLNSLLNTYGKAIGTTISTPTGTPDSFVLNIEDLENLRYGTRVLLQSIMEIACGERPPDTPLSDLFREALQAEAEFRQEGREFLASGDPDAELIRHDMDIRKYPDIDPEAELREIMEIEKEEGEELGNELKGDSKWEAG